MTRHTLRRGVLAGTALAMVFSAAPARADTLAAFDVVSSRGDLDVAALNLATLRPVPLPPGINTPAQEYGPTLSPDGKRIAFVREEPGPAAAGAPPGDGHNRRIVAFDLARGRDLTPASLAPRADQDVSPAFSLDGRLLLYGRHGVNRVPPEQEPGYVDAANLPTSSARRELDSGIFAPQYGCAGRSGQTLLGPCRTAIVRSLTPSAGLGATPTIAWALQTYVDERPGEIAATQIVVRRLGGTAIRRDVRNVRIDQDDLGAQVAGDEQLSRSATPGLLGHPAVSEAPFVLYEFRRETGRNVFAPADLNVLKLSDGTTSSDFLRGLTGDSAPVNTAQGDEQMPVFSPDGRLFAFLRGAGGRLRLLVYDSETQLPLLGATGVDVGALPSASQPAFFLRRQFGNLSLAEFAKPPEIRCPDRACEDFEFTFGGGSQGKNGGAGTGTLVAGSILIQRVVGTTAAFGRASARLKAIGTIGLGRKALDRRFSVPTDFEIGGRPLADGQYWFTVQRLAPKGGMPAALSAPLEVTYRSGRILRFTTPPPRLCPKCKR